ncbi:hypothetical protein LI951_10770 [Enterococcus sp. BWT-B8]|uniref:hypothetical protein n=1 Tax=unclassified Enterococcus TaxID=2608891 RepID=UPI001E51C55E|nr:MULTISPECIES: hypothetical protein [unclassified Enterococcus]MCB5952548.1 hypothetical protein [Enterococcus sp. BWT-B8]MCB5953410.1 hypothetical protein [Enterococcus sp. CWB-B31]
MDYYTASMYIRYRLGFISWKNFLIMCGHEADRRCKEKSDCSCFLVFLTEAEGKQKLFREVRQRNQAEVSKGDSTSDTVESFFDTFYNEEIC